MKKLLCVIISAVLLCTSVSFVFAVNEQTGFAEAGKETTVEAMSMVTEPLHFGFEIVSVGRDGVTAEFVSEGRITDPPYVGIKGTKMSAEKIGNLRYVLEYGKEYSFAYTVTEGTAETIYFADVGVKPTSTEDLEVTVTNVFRIIVSDTGDRLSASDTETEPNDTMAQACWMDEDCETLGTITSESDVDWWVVEFSESGRGLFALYNIPDGCDFDLTLYDETCWGTEIDWLEESINSDQTPESISWTVEAGVEYYLKITTFEGASTTETYSVRAKVYPSQPEEPETEEPETEEPEPEVPTIPSGAIGVYVTDEIGYPISDAVVYVYPQKYASSMYPCFPEVTDELGYAIVTGLDESQTYGVNVIADDYASNLISSFVYPSTSFYEVTLDDRHSIQLNDPLTGFSSAYQWGHGGGKSMIGCTSVCSQYIRLCPHEYMNVQTPQNYGWRYDHQARLEFHQAIDVGVAFDTPQYNVYTSAAVVYKSNIETGCGLTVQLYSQNLRLFATYMHLKSTHLQKDDVVGAGDTIGKSGNSGTNDPHMHFSLATSDILAAGRNYVSDSIIDWTAADIEMFVDPLAYIH